MRKFSEYYRDGMNLVDDKYGSYHRELANIINKFVDDLLEYNTLKSFALINGFEIVGEATIPLIGNVCHIDSYVLSPITADEIQIRLKDGSQYFNNLYQFIADVLNRSKIFWNAYYQFPKVNKMTIGYFNLPVLMPYTLDFTKWGEYVKTIVTAMKITDPKILYEQLDVGVENAFNDITIFTPQYMMLPEPITTTSGGIISPGTCSITTKLNLGMI